MAPSELHNDAGAGGGTASTGGGTTSTGGGTAATGGGVASGGGAVDPVSCSDDGLCWQGQKYGGTLRAIHGVGGSFAVAVGDNGVIATYDGVRWAFTASPTRKTLNAVWLASPTRGFAAGNDGTLLELSGTTWSSVASGTTRDLLTLHGFDEQTVYAAGVDVVLQRESTGWHTVDAHLPVTDSPAVVQALWVVGPADVYLGGAHFHLHFDGMGWSPVTGSDAPTDSDSVHAYSQCGSALYAAGIWTGEVPTTWVRESGTWARSGYYGPKVFCASSAELWSFGTAYGGSSSAVRRHTTGGVDEQLEVPRSVRAMWSSGANPVWMVGEGGSIMRWDGSTISSFGAEPLPAAVQLISASAANNVWVLRANQTLARFDGTTWATIAGPTGASLITAFYAPSPGEAWVLTLPDMTGMRRVYHWVQGSWVERTVLPFMNHITGSGPTDVWFSGAASAVQHWDGATLSTVSVPTPVSQTLGPVLSIGGEQWVSRHSNSVLGAMRRRGGTFSATNLEAWRFAATSATRVYFTNSMGLHLWNGTQVSDVTVENVDARLVAVTADEVFVSTRVYGSGGGVSALARVKGAAVRYMSVGTSDELTSLAVTPEGDVWVATSGGGLLRGR